MSKTSKLLSMVCLFAAALAARGAELGLMHPTTATLHAWQASYANLSRFTAPSGVKRAAGNVNLLSHLQYDAALRNQGATGTCWLWATQGVMSIDYRIKTGDTVALPQGFSTQFPAANAWMMGATLQSGGNVIMAASFFDMAAYTIPWSNTHASWKDGDGNDNVKSSWIHTTPNVPVSSIAPSTISTWNIPKEDAVANIKAALDQKKPIYFSWGMATSADWDEFDAYWKDKPETAIIQLDKNAGKTWNAGSAHAVVCVGYNDESANPAEHYWLILNSWGTADGGRPQGTFRAAMDMNYSATIKDEKGKDLNMFHWHVIDTAFAEAISKWVKSIGFNYKTNARGQADAFTLDQVSFRAEKAPADVYSAKLTINNNTFVCSPATGSWARKNNGFSFKSNPKTKPAIRIDIDTKTNTWTAKIGKAEIARYISYYDGLLFSLEYAATEGGEEYQLGPKRAFMYDELPSSARGRGGE